MVTATGETIRQLRETAGLGRRELADAADISQVFLSKLEQGERRPSPQTLVKIARALGLSVSDLAAKIAVFEASTAPTKDEMHRSLLRAAAISGGAAVIGALPLIPGIATMGAAALAARRKQQAARKVGDESSFDVDELRRELVAKVQDMPADQLTILAALVEDVWASFESGTR
ncbi:MAG: helix-turn-helix domain-containing protein [Pseudonocardiaceae bacterium]